MVSIQNGVFVPMPFAEMLDPKTGRTRVRRVNPASTRFQIAREYMIRLRKSDLKDPYALSKLAEVVGLQGRRIQSSSSRTSSRMNRRRHSQARAGRLVRAGRVPRPGLSRRRRGPRPAGYRRVSATGPLAAWSMSASTRCAQIECNHVRRP